MDQQKMDQQKWRQYDEAKAFVWTLGLTSKLEWNAFSKSGEKPSDIPSHPDVKYRQEFLGWKDWLGPTFRDARTIAKRSYTGAKAYALSLRLRNVEAWVAHCKSGQKPADIPSAPDQAYGKEFEGWTVFLGTENLRPKDRGLLSCDDTMAYIKRLGLSSQEEWRAHCRSGAKPSNVLSDPARKFGEAFRWSECLQPRERQLLPYVEARRFVRALRLQSKDEWSAYCASGDKPRDIPANPYQAYPSECKGMADWLGVTNKWTKEALLALLTDLRPELPHLEDRELFDILRSNKSLRPLKLVLSASATAVLKDLRNGAGEGIERAIQRASEDSLSDTQSDEDDEFEVVEAVPPLHTDRTGSHELFTPEDGGTSDGQSQLISDQKNDTSLARLASQYGLRLADHLVDFIGLDDETAESLVSTRVAALWDRFTNEGRETVYDLLAAQGGHWYTEIKNRFLLELADAENLNLPKGWDFRIGGRVQEPNMMQRRTACMVRAKRRIGNWSGTGSGKTLAAILSTRVVDARATLIIANNAVVDGWKNQIAQAFPDSVVHEGISESAMIDPERHNYFVFNYEKFQGQNRDKLAAQLLRLPLDFIVLDEVQFVKQRGDAVSKRRTAIGALVQKAAVQRPDIFVLGMSATPVVNELGEARALLEIVTGSSFGRLDTRPTVENALAMHRALMQNGFRYKPHYEQELKTIPVSAVHNELLDDLCAVRSNPLAVEQVLLPARLKAVRDYVRRGTVLYSHYVRGMVAPIRRFVEGMGLTVGEYTGEDKSGRDAFLRGEVDVLIGSSPIGTGVDGLQKRSDRLIMLSLPWTGAQYEQIIGRIYRQGSPFGTAEVIVPQVVLENGGSIWSWDQTRMRYIQEKRTLSDCAVDGTLPRLDQMTEHQLLAESRRELDNWIARLRQGTER